MADLIAKYVNQFKELMNIQKKAFNNLSSAPGIKIMIALKEAMKGLTKSLQKEINEKIKSHKTKIMES